MARTRRPAGEAQRLYERLGQEIEKAFTARDWTQKQLGAAIDEAQTTVSDYKQAKVRVPLDAVVAIEDALGLDRGSLLVEAGYVDLDAIATEQAIKRDSRIDDGFRELLLDFYRFAVERSEPALPVNINRLEVPGLAEMIDEADPDVQELRKLQAPPGTEAGLPKETVDKLAAEVTRTKAEQAPPRRRRPGR